MKKQTVPKLLLATALFTGVGASAATYWPQFRGPNGAGISDRAKSPVHFGPGSNELWHVKVPSGLSSPCVWGDSIFLTAFNDGKLSVLAVDRKSGKLRWEKPVPAATIE